MDSESDHESKTKSGFNPGTSIANVSPYSEYTDLLSNNISSELHHVGTYGINKEAKIELNCVSQNAGPHTKNTQKEEEKNCWQRGETQFLQENQKDYGVLVKKRKKRMYSQNWRENKKKKFEDLENEVKSIRAEKDKIQEKLEAVNKKLDIFNKTEEKLPEEIKAIYKKTKSEVESSIQSQEDSNEGDTGRPVQHSSNNKPTFSDAKKTIFFLVVIAFFLLYAGTNQTYPLDDNQKMQLDNYSYYTQTEYNQQLCEGHHSLLNKTESGGVVLYFQKNDDDKMETSSIGEENLNNNHGENIYIGSSWIDFESSQSTKQNDYACPNLIVQEEYVKEIIKNEPLQDMLANLHAIIQIVEKIIEESKGNPMSSITYHQQKY